MNCSLAAEAHDAHGELAVNIYQFAAAYDTALRTDLERSSEWAPQRDDLPDRQLGHLTQRQLRYADYAWEPPRQGGERRADDGEEPGEGG